MGHRRRERNGLGVGEPLSVQTEAEMGMLFRLVCSKPLGWPKVRIVGESESREGGRSPPDKGRPFPESLHGDLHSERSTKLPP